MQLDTYYIQLCLPKTEEYHPPNWNLQGFLISFLVLLRVMLIFPMGESPSGEYVPGIRCPAGQLEESSTWCSHLRAEGVLMSFNA